MSAPADDDAPVADPRSGAAPPKVRGLIIWGLIGIVLVVVGAASLLMGRHTSSSGQSQGTATIKVGDHVRVKLIHTDIQRGFIDFARV